MGLLEELINKRANAYELRGTFVEKRDGFVRAVETQDELIADLDRAIAALSPAPSEEAGNVDIGEIKIKPGEIKYILIEPAAEAKGEDETSAQQPVAYFTTQDGCMELRADGTMHNLSIAASEQHAEESARAQDPLLPPERPPVATPEQLEATGVIDGEAGWWGRKLMKERA